MEFDLVFEGGGAKGNIFVGALETFEAAGHTARRYVGTSAGAITATMMAAGCKAERMLEIVNEKLDDGRPRFAAFMDVPREFSKKDQRESVTYAIFKKVDLPWVPEMAEGYIDEKIIDGLMTLPAYRVMFSFVERGGLYEGNEFVGWLREKLDEQYSGLANATLREFHEATGKDLTAIASDTHSHDMLILNHRTAPDCPVVWAVRMSMSIPFVWQEVRWSPKWGQYRGEDLSGHTIVDGGALSNFPMRLIATDDDDVQELMGDTDPFAVPNLGFLIDETMDVPGAPPRPDGDDGDSPLSDIGKLKTVRRAMRLMDTMTDAHDRLAIRAYEKDVCRLPAKGYGTTEFDMTPERLQPLLAAGRVAMQAHLAARGG